MITGIVIVLFAAELQPYPIKFSGVTLFFWLSIITVAVLSICLVTLLLFESEVVTFWLMGSYLVIMTVLDLVFLTDHVHTFWMPTFISLGVLSIIWILHFFEVPQRWYYDMRLLHLYFQSYFFITLMTLLLIL